MSELPNGYSRAKFEDIGEWMKSMDTKIDGLIVDVARLKVQSSVWGFCAGAIPVAIALVVAAIKGWF